MRQVLVLISLWISINGAIAQGNTPDPNYLEDQFYIGFTYNFLANRPPGFIQRNLSYGLMLGFIKDIPINKERNIGMGLGIGYSTNSYYSNLVVSEMSLGNQYLVNDEGQLAFDRSKLETHAIEFPFEFRFRNSNATTYKFWRLYTGVKASYLWNRTSKLVQESTAESFSNDELQQWEYGVTLNVGYNTWNLHFYYGLSPFFENISTDQGQPLEIFPIRVGLIFYIL